MLLQPLLIELWSNKDESAFAVKLSSDQEDQFRAATTMTMQSRDNCKFTNIVDQMYYDDSFHYDWPFMLEKWIETWKSGFRHSASITSQRGYWQSSNSNKETSFEQKSDSNNTERLRRINHKWRKPSQKCHYCNLMFYDVAGRSAHEETWHAQKLLKSNDNGLKFDGDGRPRYGVRNNGR